MVGKQSRGDMTKLFVDNPNEGPHGAPGAIIGAKRRRRTNSRRGEPCSQRADVGIAGPPCRRARLAAPPRSVALSLNLPCQITVANTTVAAKVVAPKEVAAKSAAIDEERRRKAEQVAVPNEVADKSESIDEEKRLTGEEAFFLREFRAVLISLDRRPDRLDGCATRLAAFCPGLRWDKMSAVDGRQAAIGANMVTTSWDTTENAVYQRIRSERKGWDDLHTYHERVLELSPGERGCAASHIKAWRHCLASGSESPLIVLEDDAAPMPDFAGILKRALAALPSDAHVLYLGYSQAAHWRREISPELVEAEYVWTTVGYIVWPAGARLLLDKLPINQPVDNYMALLCATGQLKAYCVRPKLIRQSDAWNCGSDIRHSDENYWGPDSDIMHSETAPVPPNNPSTRSIPGAILEDGSSFWDLSSAPKEDDLLQ